MKHFNKQSREYKLLKYTWKLSLMKYDNLNLNKTKPLTMTNILKIILHRNMLF